MARYVILNPDNIVVNIIEWNGVDSYNPGDENTLMHVPSPGIGFTWNGFDFDPPLVVEQPVEEEIVEETPVPEDVPVSSPEESGV